VTVPDQRIQVASAVGDFVAARVPQSIDEVNRLRAEQFDRQPASRTGSVRASASAGTSAGQSGGDELMRRNAELELQVQELIREKEEARNSVLGKEAMLSAESAKCRALREQLIASKEQAHS
jgi:hypothetical protein